MATGSSASPKPILVESCYRSPSANSQYLDNMCDMLDNVCDINREVYCLSQLLVMHAPIKKMTVK